MTSAQIRAAAATGHPASREFLIAVAEAMEEIEHERARAVATLDAIVADAQDDARAAEAAVGGGRVVVLAERRAR
jgi:hypothetical protein